MFIKKINYRAQNNVSEYPANLPIVKGLIANDGLRLEKPLTFFVGENGAGKSTLIEAIAVAFGLNLEGGSKNFNFATRESHSTLGEQIILSKTGLLPRSTFFLRAETYYNIASEVDNLELAPYYETDSLHHLSHGEGMLRIVQERFSPNGFYILDEPESGLSVSRQLSLLKEIIQLVQAGSQIIIATHSPILLAAPSAEIWEITHEKLQKISYEECDAYRDMKLFLDDPKRMLHYLLEE